MKAGVGAATAGRPQAEEVQLTLQCSRPAERHSTATHLPRVPSNGCQRASKSMQEAGIELCPCSGQGMNDPATGKANEERMLTPPHTRTRRAAV